jgi:hypothetical protein
MMNSPVLERMKGRYRKGILELAQAGGAGRFGENFGKILLQIRKMKIETKLIFCFPLMWNTPDRTSGTVCMYPAWDPWE